MFFKKVSVCVLFALGFAVLVPIAADAQKIELRSAKIYIRETPPQWDKALALLETALEKDPGNNDAHYLLGLIHYYRGNFDLMFKNWEATTINDLDRNDRNQYKTTLNSMIRTNYQVGQQSYEKGEYAKAVDFYSRSVNATSMLQSALRSTGKKDDAKTADELGPAKQQGYLYWGYAALGAGDDDNARLALETLLELDPDRFEAWDGLINVYYTSEDWNKLIMACNKVIELSEEIDLNTYLILRNAYFGVADTASVIATYERAMAAFPEEQTLYRDVSSLHSVKKDYDRAIEVLEKGHASLPDDVELLRYLGINHYNLGVSAREAGDVEAASTALSSAVDSMNKLLVLQSNSIDGHDILSDAYYGLAGIETDEAKKQEFAAKGAEHQQKKMDLIKSGEGM